MAQHILCINDEQVKKVLKYDDLIPLMEKACAQFSKGSVLQPVRSIIPIEKHNGWFRVMPGYSPDEDILAVKLVTFNASENRDMPIYHIMLYDGKTGQLKALMDADHLSAMRTAAASAAVTKHLAPESPQVLAVLGAGIQGQSHIHALSSVYKFKEIRIWSRTFSNAEKLVNDCSSEGSQVFICQTVKEAVCNADIIVTATHGAETPFLFKDWIKPGAHINAVGGCDPKGREIADDLMHGCVLYTDTKEGAMKESGDIIAAKAKIYAEIGEMFLGQKEAKRDEITMFKSLGMAIEDVLAAKLVYEKVTGESY